MRCSLTVKKFLFLTLVLFFATNLNSQYLNEPTLPKSKKEKQCYQNYPSEAYSAGVVGKNFFRLFSTGKEKRAVFRDVRNGKTFEPVFISTLKDTQTKEETSLVYFKNECTQSYEATLYYAPHQIGLPKLAVLNFKLNKNNKTIDAVIWVKDRIDYYLLRSLIHHEKRKRV